MKRNFFLAAALFFTFAACNSKKETGEPKTEPEAAAPKPKKRQLIKGIALASPIDTICGMPVKNGAADTLMLDGKIYGFCATGCKDLFIKQLQEEKQSKGKKKK